MKLNSGLSLRLLLFVTPIFFGSAIATSPSQAATFATSEARVKMSNFSQDPIGVRTLTDTYTYTKATSGSVTANADANAIAQFDPIQPPKFFSNFSNSTASGQGRDYLGFAQSFAEVIGYDFFVPAKQAFSFNFDAFLGLKTSVDNPQYESASAAGLISFDLIDSANNSLLEEFTISGTSSSITGNSLKYDKPASLTFASIPTLNTAFEGKYSRSFTNSTYLTLVEVKRNEVIVKAPESSSSVALLGFSLIGIGYGVKRKVFAGKVIGNW